MDPIPLCLAMPRLPQGGSPPHPPHLPHIIAGVPKAIIMPEAEGLWFKDIGHNAPGEPKGVHAKPFIHTRKDKVMGTRLNRLNFGCPWDSQGEPAQPSQLLLLCNK